MIFWNRALVFGSRSRENDVDKLRYLGEALAQGADAALVGKVRQSRDVQAHVVDPQDVESAHLLGITRNKKMYTRYQAHISEKGKKRGTPTNESKKRGQRRSRT